MPEASFAPLSLKFRGAYAARAAVIHLLLSAIVVGGGATLVFGLWYPYLLRELMGGTELLLLIVGVNVICGPLLTFVIFNPAKPRIELRRDLFIVVFIQLVALAYGIHTLAYARPVALVFEVDRFRVVSYSDLDEVETENTNFPPWARPWSLTRPRTVGLRSVSTSAEKMASINASLQGVEPSQRPTWWQDYTLNTAQVLQRARPLDELRGKYPDHSALIDAAVERALGNAQPGETTDAFALRWLPLVSRRAADWVVLIDPQSARLRGYVHVDGFF